MANSTLPSELFGKKIDLYTTEKPPCPTEVPIISKKKN
jgi:hypothetical protein